MSGIALSHVLAVVMNSVVLLAAVLAITHLLRRTSASLRCQILLGGFLGLLALPVLTFVMPSWSLPWGLAVGPQDSRVNTAGGNDAGSMTAAVAGAVTPSAARESLPAKETHSPAQGVGDSTPAGSWLPLAALASWGLGALAVFTVQLIRWVNVGKIAETATLLDTGHAKALVEGITKDLNIRSPVILLQSEMATVSMVWGLRHPSVILPADSAEWSDEKLATVLRHELSHIKRHDNMVHLLALVACAFYWLNPLVWMSLRKLRFEREVACDDSVLNSGTLASAYARHLMEVTMSLSKTTSQMLLPAAMADSSDVKKRLLSILNADTNRRPMARTCAALCILASLCLAVPVAGFRLSVDDSAAAREESDVTGRNKFVDRGEAPSTLHNAATFGDTHFAEMLLVDGADVNARDGALQTPLHQAAIFGHARIARLLLDAGADVDGRDRNGQTPLHGAAAFGRFDVADLLLDDGAEVNARDRRGQSALHGAAIFGHARVAGMLIAKGAEVRAKDGGGRTPFHEAATFGHFDVAELLLDEGAEVNARDGRGQSALHQAAIFGYARLARMLIAEGAEVRAKDGRGQTPLHEAAVYGQFDVADLLLDEGAEVNARDKGGEIALHEAAVYGYVRVAGMLIAKGAEVSAKDEGGQTPLHEAAVYGHFDVADLLLDEGADVNARNRGGQIALHEAAVYGHARVAGVLLDKGANIDSRDDQGYTPLDKADINGHQDVCEILRARGAK